MVLLWRPKTSRMEMIFLIKLVRLDYRLLHGQVCFSWVQHVGAERIIVVDDDSATNDLKKSALKLAKPQGVRLNVFTGAQVVAKLDKIRSLSENIIIIFGNTDTLLEFCKVAPEVASINYGATANKAGAKQFDESIFLTEAQQADTQAILELGRNIYMQQTPSAVSRPLEHI